MEEGELIGWGMKKIRKLVGVRKVDEVMRYESTARRCRHMKGMNENRMVKGVFNSGLPCERVGRACKTLIEGVREILEYLV